MNSLDTFIPFSVLAKMAGRQIQKIIEEKILKY